MPERETIDSPVNARSEPASLPQQMPDEPYYRQAETPSGSRRRLGIALLIVGLIWLAAMGTSRGLFFGFGDGGRLINDTYTANRLVMDVSVGDVEIRPWDSDEIQVEALYRGGSADDYAITVDNTDGTLRITGGLKQCFVFCPAQDVEYHIRVPASAAASVKTTTGEIDAAGLTGQVVLSTVNEQIEASDISNGLQANTVNGKVELREIGGPLNVTTTNGDVELEAGNTSGVKVHTINGDISLQGVSGALDIQTVNGDIAVRDASDARLTVSTTNGDVEYEGSLAGGDHTINTVSKDVSLRIPADSNLTLAASTVSGDLETDFDLGDRQEDGRSLRGSIGRGGGSLTIGTVSGDVQVERE